MSEWLEELGYIGVFLAAGLDGIFPIVPGESTVIAAAVLAAEGHLSLWIVILAGALGAVVGDSAAYRIGATGQGRFKNWMIGRLGERRIAAAEDLLRRLTQDVLLATAGPRDLPERQRTINATVAWSYQLLAPDEQRVFRRLGVLPGRFPIEAAAG